MTPSTALLDFNVRCDECPNPAKHALQLPCGSAVCEETAPAELTAPDCQLGVTWGVALIASQGPKGACARPCRMTCCPNCQGVAERLSGIKLHVVDRIV